jgi:hypothetical protein
LIDGGKLTIGEEVGFLEGSYAYHTARDEEETEERWVIVRSKLARGGSGCDAHGARRRRSARQKHPGLGVGGGIGVAHLFQRGPRHGQVVGDAAQELLESLF